MDQQLHTIRMNDVTSNHIEHRMLRDIYLIPSPLKIILLSYKTYLAQTGFHAFVHIIPPALRATLILPTLGSIVKQINEISLNAYV